MVAFFTLYNTEEKQAMHNQQLLQTKIDNFKAKISLYCTISEATYLQSEASLQRTQIHFCISYYVSTWFPLSLFTALAKIANFGSKLSLQ